MDLDLKAEILKELEKHGECFKPIKRNQYIMRCPICGDTSKDPRHAHCYIKSTDYDESPILYNCFLCNSSGVVNRYFLSKLNINKSVLNKIKDSRNNTFSLFKSRNDIDLNISLDMNSPQIKYIENRVGEGLTIEDYKKFRIVNNMDDIRPLIQSDKIRNILPSNVNSVSFLSDDYSVLLTRNFSDSSERWTKLRLYQTSDNSIYTIKTSIDLFTQDEINVNISEGVIDAISTYKNFNGHNSVNIAVLGSNYSIGIEYIISKGIIGNNVNINIYMDDNIKINKLKKELKKYRWLFNKINVFENIKFKDVGTTIDNIRLKKYKV